MAKQRHLSRAPINEALIDIHVAPRDGLKHADLTASIGEPDFGYYVKGSIAQGFFNVELPTNGRTPQTRAQAELVGVRLHSLDERYVAQFRTTGFTLSRLPPYEEWERLVEETRRVWAIYVARLAPRRVIRVATRFINNLRLPMRPGDSYQTYLQKLADVPEEAPQAMASFLQRFQLVDMETGARVNLTLAVDETPESPPVPVILDIDAFMLIDLDPADAQVWTILERLRQLKNRTFFSTITERAAELYQ